MVLISWIPQSTARCTGSQSLRCPISVIGTGFRRARSPGAWDHPANTPLKSGGLTYAGDGSGDTRLRISPSNPAVGRFGGTIDDLMVHQPRSGRPGTVLIVR